MTGDPRSNTARFRRHFAALHHFFVNKTANDHDAEDLAQQTLLACLEAMRRYRGDASFRTFLFAIARNTLLKHLRDRRIHVDLETQSRTLTDLGLGFTTLMDVRREQELLLRGLLCLSIDSQLILERYYWERMSARQIAARLEVSEAAVRGRLRKAKLELRAALDSLVCSRKRTTQTLEGFDAWVTSLADAEKITRRPRLESRRSASS